MRRRVPLIAALGAFALAGCATMYPPKEPEHPLRAHNWQLVQIAPDRGSPIRLTGEQQARHKLEFLGEGRLALTLDCNRGNASWFAGEPTNGNGTLSIGAIASTRAMCPPDSRADAMAAGLPSAKAFTVQPDGRSLTITTADAVFAFVAAD